MVATVKEDTERKYLDGHWLTEEETMIQYERLVYYMTRNTSYLRRLQSVDSEDAMSYAYMGLIKAYREYDGTKGMKFLSYASRRIKQTVYRELNQDGNFIGFSYGVKEAAITINKNGWAELPEEEIMELLNQNKKKGMSRFGEKRVKAALACLRVGKVNLVDGKTDEEDSESAEVALKPIDLITSEDDHSLFLMDSFFNELTEREQKVVAAKTDRDVSQKDIQRMTGIPDKTVNWDIRKIKQKLVKHLLENEVPISYIDQIDPNHVTSK